MSALLASGCGPWTACSLQMNSIISLIHHDPLVDANGELRVGFVVDGHIDLERSEGTTEPLGHLQGTVHGCRSRPASRPSRRPEVGGFHHQRVALEPAARVAGTTTGRIVVGRRSPVHDVAQPIVDYVMSIRFFVWTICSLAVVYCISRSQHHTSGLSLLLSAIRFFFSSAAHGWIGNGNPRPATS